MTSTRLHGNHPQAPKARRALARALAAGLAIAPLGARGDELPPLRLSLQTEGAAGVATGGFYNHLAGARLDLRFSPTVALGASLAYVNLKGPDGRAHGVLPAAQIEWRPPLPAHPRLSLPLRFATGYLPRNGPVARASAGLAFALADQVELGVDLLAPMAWVSHDELLLSMNVALELAIALGR
jgi:hypothetical protein